MLSLCRLSCIDNDAAHNRGTQHDDGARPKHYDGARSKHYDGARSKHYGARMEHGRNIMDHDDDGEHGRNMMIAHGAEEE